MVMMYGLPDEARAGGAAYGTQYAAETTAVTDVANQTIFNNLRDTAIAHFADKAAELVASGTPGPVADEWRNAAFATFFSDLKTRYNLSASA
jgi:hypothetical protein